MIKIGRNKASVDKAFVDECVRAYFNCLRGFGLTGKEVSELFRYSMCRVMDLQSIGASVRIMEASKMVVNVLLPIYNRYGYENCSELEKQGILEACVHCMEMSRKRAGV